MANDPAEQFEGYSLLMPFVVCASNGGPFDDRTFCAGVRLGQIDTLLKLRPSHHAVYVEPELVPQLDLLAMHHGYRFRGTPWAEHPEDWVLAEFGGDELLQDEDD